MAPRDKKQEEVVTTTVAFDKVTYKRLKLRAVEEETTVRELIREAVAAYLGRQQRRRRTP